MYYNNVVLSKNEKYLWSGITKGVSDYVWTKVPCLILDATSKDVTIKSLDDNEVSYFTKRDLLDSEVVFQKL